MKKRLLACLMTAVMLVSLFPLPALAAEAEPYTGGLCHHHQEHSYEVCGYVEAVEGQPCGHVHDGDCGYVEAVPEVPCDMDCAETDGDGQIVHNQGCADTPAVEGAPCQHEHDGLCGYVEAVEGRPCGYICRICPVQALIDALPTDKELNGMNKDEQNEVYNALQAAYDAYEALTNEQKEEIAGTEVFESLFAFFNGMTNALATVNGVSYLDAGGNQRTANNVTVVESASGGEITWNTGWYVVNGSNVMMGSDSSQCNIAVEGDVHLILADGCKLTVTAGIRVTENNRLTIYGQDVGSGQLITTGRLYEAGIGGGSWQNAGNITINGGNITATGGHNAAGIGGGSDGNGGEIIINGGTVKAAGGGDAPDIGGGARQSADKIVIGDRADVTNGSGEKPTLGPVHGVNNDKWASNETQHWHPCGVSGCDISNHQSAKEDHDLTSKTDLTTGAIINECSVCGYINRHVVNTNAWASNGTQHWHPCGVSGCDISNHQSAKEDHDLTSKTDLTTGAIINECSVCGSRHVVNTNAWASNETQHWHPCGVSGCNISDHQSAKENHNWTPKTDPSTDEVINECSECGAMKGVCGDFVIAWGEYGTDYSYDRAGRTLTILSSNPLKISGTTKSDKIVIAQNVTANITLENVYIDVSGTYYACAFDVAGSAVCNLTLKGQNTLKSGQARAGLRVPGTETQTAKLIISEDPNTGGSLSAFGGDNGAGIGGGDNQKGGTIIINSGTVTAQGHNGGAGIGGSRGKDGGVIEINGGTVNATADGGYWCSFAGAGIGGGGCYNNSNDTAGSGGQITINGGIVTATSKKNGAGIGSGASGSESNSANGGTILITGGTVTATSGRYESGFGGAGIGGGNRGGGGSVTITGGTVTAKGDANAPSDIGDGVNGTGGTFSTGSDGHAVIYADRISDETGKSNCTALIYTYDKKTGQVYGNLTVQDNMTIDAKQVLTVLDGSDLTIGDNTILTNNGTIIIEQGGTLQINETGKLVNNGTITNNSNSQGITGTGTIEGRGTLTGTGTIAPTITDNMVSPPVFTTPPSNATVSALASVTFTAEAAGKPVPTYQWQVDKGSGWEDISDATNSRYTISTTSGNMSGWQYRCIATNSEGSAESSAATLTVNKLTPIVTRPTAASGLTYTGEAQNLISAGSTSGGELQYSTDGTYYSATVPTGTDAKPYTVYYKVVGNDNYDDVTAQYVSVTIDPKSISGATVTLGDSLTYTGQQQTQTVSSVTIDGLTATYTVSDNQQTDAETYTLTVTGSGNFTGTQTKEFTIAKATNSITGLTCADIVFGESPNPSATATFGTPAYSYSTSESGTYGDWNTSNPKGTWYVKASVTGTDNYNAAEATISFQVTAQREATPSASIDYGAETLTGLTAGASYSITPAGGTAVTVAAGADGTIAIQEGWFGKALSIVKIARNADYSNSEPQSLSIPARPNAPTAPLKLTKAANSITVTNMGSYPGCEFYTDGTPWNDTGAFAGLTAGTAYTVQVRVKATASTFKSASMTQAVTTVAVDGSTTVKPGESVTTGGTTITNDGEKTTITGGGTTTTVTPPADGGSVNVGTDGGVTVPGGSTVKTGDDGPEITVGDKGGTVAGDGKITIPGGGTIQTGDPATTITVPEGGGTIHPKPGGTVEVPGGSTIKTGDGAEITVGPGNGGSVGGDGGVTVPDGGTIQIGKNPATTVTPPPGGEVKPKEDGTVEVPDGTTVKPGDGGPDITVGPGNSGTIGGNGGVTVEGGGKVTVKGNPDNTTITLPSGGGTVKPNPDGTITLPGNSTVEKGGTTTTVPGAGGTYHPDTGTITENTHTVTFDSQGGSAVNSATATHGGTVAKPGNPTKSGYTFGGWYKESSCTTAWNFDTDTVTGDITLYAKWTQNSNGGGGGWYNPSTTYSVTVPTMAHGKVTVSPTSASRGTTVTITAIPEDGYRLDTLNVTSSGKAVPLTEKGSGKYTFTMPAGTVKVTATFVLAETPETPWNNPFADVSEGDWYYEAVRFVQERGLMNGYSDGRFGPNDTLSRAQLAQILFNKEGRPGVNYLMDFSDVAGEAWYTEAIRWATSQGIVGGYGNGMFGPNDPITREQLAVMLWRYSGSPAATNKELHFADADEISPFALEAMRWAVENGILNGYGDGRLGPQGQATRAQVAQMLKNFIENQEENT
ncbi:S-layer homology domain-containing protein [Oscillospiraceae bacterium 50-16]